jgi:hypothetical protein
LDPAVFPARAQLTLAANESEKLRGMLEINIESISLKIAPEVVEVNLLSLYQLYSTMRPSSLLHHVSGLHGRTALHNASSAGPSSAELRDATTS